MKFLKNYLKKEIQTRYFSAKSTFSFYFLHKSNRKKKTPAVTKSLVNPPPDYYRKNGVEQSKHLHRSHATTQEGNSLEKNPGNEMHGNLSSSRRKAERGVVLSKPSAVINCDFQLITAATVMYLPQVHWLTVNRQYLQFSICLNNVSGQILYEQRKKIQLRFIDHQNCTEGRLLEGGWG